MPSKQIQTGQYRLLSETSLEWRFAVGPIVAQGHVLIQNSLPEGVHRFFFYFLVDEGKEFPNTTIIGPLFPQQLNAILRVFR